MKRSERHHLKENALAVVIAGFQQRAESWRADLLTGMAVVVGILMLYGGYSWWTQRAESSAGALLADALVVADAPVVPPPPPPVVNRPAPESDDPDAEVAETPEPPPFVQPEGSYPTVEAKMSASLPKLLEAAGAYPKTHPGITARYRAAAALSTLGRYDEAAEHYQQLIDAGNAGVYARMATLGLASLEIYRGAYDAAIALLESVTTPETVAELPIDSVLMELGRAYQLAGRTGDARAAFQRVMDEFPTSLYFTNAQRELQTLQIEG